MSLIPKKTDALCGAMQHQVTSPGHYVLLRLYNCVYTFAMIITWSFMCLKECPHIKAFYLLCSVHVLPSTFVNIYRHCRV